MSYSEQSIFFENKYDEEITALKYISSYKLLVVGDIKGNLFVIDYTTKTILYDISMPNGSAERI